MRVFISKRNSVSQAKAALLFLLTLTFLPVSSGCGGGGSKSSSKQTADETRLLGRWRIASILSPSQTVPCPRDIPGGPSCGTSDLITFYPNYAYRTDSEEQPSASGTWKLSGNTLTLSNPEATPRSREITLSFINNGNFTAAEEGVGSFSFLFERHGFAI